MDEVLRERRRTRGVLALSIVVGGVSLAWLLGRPGTPHDINPPDAGDRIVLRRRAGPVAAELEAPSRVAPGGERGAMNAPPFPASVQATVALPGHGPDVLPPTLAKSFPSSELPASARWGVSMGIGISGTGIVGQAAHKHKIVNGDSLPELARRYLGSEDRAVEIFEANRDLLSSPDALPIGIELRIPARETSRTGAKPTEPSALVPIAPRTRGEEAPNGMSSGS